MSVKTANSSVNWQERALEFKVGDAAYPTLNGPSAQGRVTAVFPAIGMVDMEFPGGSMQVPVEDLTRVEGDDPIPPETVSTPGGAERVPVDGGPSVEKVARLHIEASLKRNALYWAALDRQYKATQGEQGTHTYMCPKCKDVALKSAVYRREGGSSLKLLGCPQCMFLIEKDSVIGHHANEAA